MEVCIYFFLHPGSFLPLRLQAPQQEPSAVALLATTAVCQGRCPQLSPLVVRIGFKQHSNPIKMTFLMHVVSA